jgi:hypothetical protein
LNPDHGTQIIGVLAIIYLRAHRHNELDCQISRPNRIHLGKKYLPLGPLAFRHVLRINKPHLAHT